MVGSAWQGALSETMFVVPPSGGRSPGQLIESLIIGAEDMLSLEVPFESDAIMTTIDIPEQPWITGQ